MSRRAALRGALPSGLAVALGALLLPAPAEAHLVTTGLGPVYDGITHLASSPQDLLFLLALSLLAGLNGVRSCRLALFAVSLAWLAGGLAALRLGGTPLLVVAAALALLVLGALTAADARLGPRGVTAIAVSLGLLHGWTNGADLATAGGGILELLGGAATIFVLVALASAFVVTRRAPWTRVAVRAAGSWVAAIGLLVLGWSLRGR